MKTRLAGHGGVANPRDTSGYRCGLRLALTRNASISFRARTCEPVYLAQLVTDRAKGTFPESFAPFLAYPATLIELKRPDEVFVINPRARLQREVPIGISTSHLLVITLGSVRGLRSVQLFDVGLTTGSVSLCFYEYDVQKFDPGKPWSCPVAPLP